VIDALLVLLSAFLIIGVGYVISWFISYSRRPDKHDGLCTHYNRCKECRQSKEPPSNFDIWDRYR